MTTIESHSQSYLSYTLNNINQYTIISIAQHYLLILNDK